MMVHVDRAPPASSVFPGRGLWATAARQRRTTTSARPRWRTAEHWAAATGMPEHAASPRWRWRRWCGAGRAITSAADRARRAGAARPAMRSPIGAGHPALQQVLVADGGHPRRVGRPGRLAAGVGGVLRGRRLRASGSAVPDPDRRGRRTGPPAAVRRHRRAAVAARPRASPAGSSTSSRSSSRATRPGRSPTACTCRPRRWSGTCPTSSTAPACVTAPPWRTSPVRTASGVGDPPVP